MEGNGAEPKLIVDPEFAAALNPVRPHARARLERQLVRDGGPRDALVVWPQPDGTEILVDGHTRLQICEQHGLPYKRARRDFPSREAAKLWIKDTQHARRNCNETQRAYDAAEEAALLQICSGRPLREIMPGVAKDFEISERLCWHAHKVREKGSPGLNEATRLGIIPVTLGDPITTLPADEQERVAAECIRSGSPLPAQRAAFEAKRRAKCGEVIKRGTPSTDGLSRYGLFYIDPPWDYGDKSIHTTQGPRADAITRRINFNYPTMSIEEIKAALGPILQKHAYLDCVLCLWATVPKLADAMDVMRAWDFEYKSQYVWVKDGAVMGRYSMVQHEILLIGTKGSPPPPTAVTGRYSVIQAPRVRHPDTGRVIHSAKPEVFYEMIEAMYPDLPKLEMFARKERPGWAVWGNEVKVAAAPSPNALDDVRAEGGSL